MLLTDFQSVWSEGMMKTKTHTVPTDNVQAQQIIGELEHGIANHTQWLKNLHRTLLCKLPPNANDLQEDAHCRCNFGHWYYEQTHPWLDKRKIFISIGELHHTMHDRARAILNKTLSGQALDKADYDHFIDKSNKFNDQIRKLQFEIINEVIAIDPLTGIANRQGMITKLQQEYERSLRNSEPCSIGMIDFDRFKHINDTFGHQVGDKVLHFAGQYLAASLRRYDSIFRYGGEEFLVILPGISSEAALTSLDRIRCGLEALPIQANESQTIHITASFGIAQFKQGITVEESIYHADQALMAAKNMGRNRIVIWED